jgi:plasmid stabilization system protein ParE
MRIRWTPAANDLQSISDYLKDHNPHYRQPTMRKIYEKIRTKRNASHRTAGTHRGDARAFVFAHALRRRVPGSQ